MVGLFYALLFALIAVVFGPRVGPVRRLVRWVIGFRAGVSREEAVERARVHAGSRGWSWQEPMHVEEGITEVFIRTAANMRGGNVCVRVGLADGSIVSAGFAPR